MRVFLLVAMLLYGPLARADSSVREHALQLFAAGKFGAAAGAFAANYALTADPTDLFAWAQAERQANQCQRAIELYSLFLSTEPPAQNRVAAVEGASLCSGEPILALTEPGILDRVKGRTTLEELHRLGYSLHGDSWFLLALGAHLAPEECSRARPLFERVARETPRFHAKESPDAAPLLRRIANQGLEQCVAGVVEPNPPDQSPPEQPPRPWYGDQLSAGLLGGGAALIVAGATVLTLGSLRVTGAEGETYGEFSDSISSGRTLMGGGGAAVALGCVAVGAAMVRILGSDDSVAVAPTATGAAVSVGWDF